MVAMLIGGARRGGGGVGTAFLRAYGRTASSDTKSLDKAKRGTSGKSGASEANANKELPRLETASIPSVVPTWQCREVERESRTVVFAASTPGCRVRHAGIPVDHGNAVRAYRTAVAAVSDAMRSGPHSYRCVFA
jgi:hypothetical protein